MYDYEKLGLFYLGRVRSLEGETTPEPFLLKSRDLTTHGVIMGMTGSGKTGLGIALLEEAAIDGIPALVIDPKGDLTNLLLTFPNMNAEDFEPWVSADDAAQQGLTMAELAERTATKWRNGLAQWDQTPERINLMRAGCDITVYTPGSTAGVPVALLKSFAPPSLAVREDAELLAGSLKSTVSSLLGLLGIEADPLKSREHMFLSALLNHAWSQGQELSIADLVAQVQKPPITTIGVMDLDSFYPSDKRFQLALALNGLLASPSFQSWLEGEKLDVSSMLFYPDGRPRMAVFSIAHLNDAERMFFVTMLAEAAVSWMRTVSGTSSLRALMYMDEVFGYLPPVANPPVKKPLLTILKQGRAFGLGLVLATQNPSDLDYKALANIGTWLIGRLQTERDRAKVMEGLREAVGASGDAKPLEAALSGLQKRVFVALTPGQVPCLFESRWTLSFLRGPVTREELKQLKGRSPGRHVETTSAVEEEVVDPFMASLGVAPDEAVPQEEMVIPGVGRVSAVAPILPIAIAQCFVPATSEACAYRPVLLGGVSVHWKDGKLGLVDDRDFIAFVPVLAGPIAVNWDKACVSEDNATELASKPVVGVGFGEVANGLGDVKLQKVWKKGLSEWVCRTAVLSVPYCPELKLAAQPGESEAAFRARLTLVLREQRDAKVEALTKKYQPKMLRLETRLKAATDAVAFEEADVLAVRQKQAVSGVVALFSLFSGINKIGKRFLSAKKKAAMEERQLSVAQGKEQALREEMKALGDELQSEIEALSQVDGASMLVETKSVPLKKSDIIVRFFGIGWVPVNKQGAVASRLHFGSFRGR